MVTSRQHYVWQHYLRKWETDKPDKVQSFIKNNNVIRGNNTRNICQKRFFYRVNRIHDADRVILLPQLQDFKKHYPSETEIISLIDNYYINQNVDDLESDDYKDVIERFYANHIEASSGQYLDIDQVKHNRSNEVFQKLFIRFCVFQYFRTKTRADRFIQAFSTKPTDEEIIKFLKRRPEYLENTLRIEEGIQRYEQIIKESLASITRHYAIIMIIYAIPLIKSIYEEIGEWHISIINNQTSDNFITGDCPVVNTFYNKKDMEHDDLELYYPISPTTALILAKKEIDDKCITEATVIEDYNNMIHENSLNFLVADKKQALEKFKTS